MVIDECDRRRTRGLGCYITHGDACPRTGPSISTDALVARFSSRCSPRRRLVWRLIDSRAVYQTDGDATPEVMRSAAAITVKGESAVRALDITAAALESRASGDSALRGQGERSGRGLTPTERHVLHLLSQGLSARQIARTRGISPRTVHKHLENVYAKLGCHDRLVAVNRGYSLGLLTANPRD